MSKRTKWLLVIAAIATLIVGWQVAAFAVHDEVFQLEGNAVDDDPPLPPAPASAVDDWANVFNNTQTGAGKGDKAFVTEPNPNSSFFTGGGSKDPEDIPAWQWKDETGGLPDKANLQHSFAASYTTGGKKLLYFGADRFDGSGDAAIGFWFFQNAVAQTPAPPAASGSFTGTHRDGDVLIISNFSNGGTVPTITVYKWDGPAGTTVCTKADNNNPGAGQCGAKNLRVVTTATQADCANPAPADEACATVNSAQDNATAPWPFTDKDGNTQFAPGEFFEGGIDLTALGLANQCFSTALAETRTSTSPTSTLKDFTVGKFGNCGSTTTTTPQDNAGNPIGANGISIGTGGEVQVKDSALVAVTNAGTATWSGTVSFFLCKVDAPGLCTTGGTPITPAKPVDNNPNTPATTTAVSDAAKVTSAGRYCWRAVFSGDQAAGVEGSSDSSATECFTVNPVTPTLTTTAGDDVALDNPITDTATLSGTANKPGTPVINPTTAGGPATGSITFTLFGPGSGNGTCGPQVNAATQTVDVTGDSSANNVYSASFTPTEPGTYHWKATYTGDSPNTNGASHNANCTEGGEEVVVGNSGVTTTPKDNAGNDITDPLSIGNGSVQVKDSATVNVTGQTTWSGNMTFFLCKVDAPDLCTSGGTQIGGNVPVSSTTPPGATVTSDAATVTSAGRYCWRGVFTATTPGVPNATDSSAGECFTVNPVTPNLATTAGEDVDLGNPITDTATLSGTANKPGTPVINPTTQGGPATGTITFTLFGPTAPGDTGCGPQVDAATQTVDVTDGDGTYPDPPVSFEPTEPGIYHWKASYTPADGDPNNLAATHNTDCSDENEDVVVTSVPSSMTTAQSFIPNDSATVSAEQGGPLNGTVTFTLFESADCSGDVKYTEDVDIVDGLASGTTVNTTNTEESTTEANVSWLVSYDSTNPAQEDIPPTCEEKTALDIQNGGTIPPPPSP